MRARVVHSAPCTQCGHVGCCDSSKNKHATKHYPRLKTHRIITRCSRVPVEWCYVDEVGWGVGLGSRCGACS